MSTNLDNITKKNEDVDENTDGTDNNHYYLAKAFLFTADQVEKLK